MEMQKARTVAAGPLRKEYKTHATGKRQLHFLLDGVRVCPPCTIYIYGPGKRRYPAHARPGFDFSLGHKHACRDGAENQNVKIAQVVGDDQASLRNVTVHPDIHSNG